jgi:hypothetical protein
MFFFATLLKLYQAQYAQQHLDIQIFGSTVAFLLKNTVVMLIFFYFP